MALAGVLPDLAEQVLAVDQLQRATAQSCEGKAKARKLLGWEPVWSVRDTIETTMRYHVEEYRKSLAAAND